jgi:hypothetical protein
MHVLLSTTGTRGGVATTSPFNLPDHLTPKADPTLIAGDEQHFAAIAESLEQSIAGLSDRLEAVPPQQHLERSRS